MQTKCKLNAKQQAEKERIVTGRMVALQIYDRQCTAALDTAQN
jgi:hypothetical protein